MVIANREFARKHPVATRRALRAILKAADICAREPERAARLLVDKGHMKNYDYALQVLKDIGYDGWIVVEQDVMPGMGTPKESAQRNRDYIRSIGL